MLPVIALVGRPNVGKSTLFNRLTRSRDALVADYSGLTRDRKYGEGKLGQHRYIVIDTGGISYNEDGIETRMSEQSFQAIEEADAVFFMVDARDGLTPADEIIASNLRRKSKCIWLVLNKTDTVDADMAATEFHGLGIGEPQPIAAAHGRGVTSLINTVLETTFDCAADAVPDENEQEDRKSQEDKGIRIAVIGRPNVGKSTLVNRLLGEDRVIVFDHAGTTRDSIYIPYERNEQKYTLIDTAGVRRKGRVTEAIEKFSVIKALQAIENSNVVILVLDARESIVDQDLHMLRYTIEAGRCLVIAMNKWDGMTPDQRNDVRSDLERRLVFIDFADIHFISAKHGSGVGNLYKSINAAYQSSIQRWTSNRLTQLLEDAVSHHQPPLVKGRRIKLRYCHMGGTNPPTFVIHGNQTDELPRAYTKYLENTFRTVLKISGTPICIECKTGDNPFAGRKNKLNERQIKKRQRMIKHVKKKEKKQKR